MRYQRGTGLSTPHCSSLPRAQGHVASNQFTSQRTLRPQESSTMKSTLLYSAAFACLASFALANPLANTNAGISRRDTAAAMGALKVCSGDRQASARCIGNRLGPQNGFQSW
ncbi:hypothetical protein H112_03884 [Trichophyton rubrum D6]|uniref:Uncharacterized protein n=3 Tax=Trichophyton TaxID=5550 RepID=A0A080WJX9_TRIRC|nr:uncharacterized protein TERG_12245 [Trichophyton rubrum CBS 118892]EZF23437.1 hypothetical protein H100_03892 [Trichophyton rubrum MR850]EZF42595.1 hypothetical protein H102_03879 [Trichophyton rubrum CBS 100081]EZF53211.1 hypothetical protein H103_03893 [Trichophyton rubrum CBS 288.86]EZF63879.1 hypothetical protein H104_03878 [Trichophyton rubrum CBS 289.86]EZF74199.1 hypothetical protein H105_03906 [Trichophyton soudanense CBS 452.61]EZF85159.1 hypothetical protein H110_03885 [Trichophy